MQRSQGACSIHDPECIENALNYNRTTCSGYILVNFFFTNVVQEDLLVCLCGVYRPTGEFLTHVET